MVTLRSTRQFCYLLLILVSTAAFADRNTNKGKVMDNARLHEIIAKVDKKDKGENGFGELTLEGVGL